MRGARLASHSLIPSQPHPGTEIRSVVLTSKSEIICQWFFPLVSFPSRSSSFKKFIFAREVVQNLIIDFALFSKFKFLKKCLELWRGPAPPQGCRPWRRLPAVSVGSGGNQ